MRRIGNHKPNFKYPIRKLAFILLTLLSCSTQSLEVENLDIIIIDPGNIETYDLNYANDPGMGWVEMPNDSIYKYSVVNSVISVTSTKPIKAAYLMLSPGKEQLEVKNNGFTHKTKKKATFRIYY